MECDNCLKNYSLYNSIYYRESLIYLCLKCTNYFKNLYGNKLELLITFKTTIEKENEIEYRYKKVKEDFYNKNLDLIQKEN